MVSSREFLHTYKHTRRSETIREPTPDTRSSREVRIRVPLFRSSILVAGDRERIPNGPRTPGAPRQNPSAECQSTSPAGSISVPGASSASACTAAQTSSSRPQVVRRSDVEWAGGYFQTKPSHKSQTQSYSKFKLSLWAFVLLSSQTQSRLKEQRRQWQ